MDEPLLSPKLNDVRYFICRGENQYGPYTVANIRQYVTQGSILYSDYLWAQGMPNRITVQTFLQATTLAVEPPPALPAPNLPAGVPHQAPMPSATLSVSPAAPAAGNALTRKAGSFFRIFSNLALLFRHLGGVLWFMILSLLSYVALGVAIGLLALTGVGLVLAILLVSAEFWVLAYLARNLAFTMSRNKRLARIA